jgi:ubiquitin-activating enzyme E1 C
MTNINAIEEMTRPNLEKTLEELDLEDQQEILVADATTPQTMIFRLKFL